MHGTDGVLFSMVMVGEPIAKVGQGCFYLCPFFDEIFFGVGIIRITKSGWGELTWHMY